MSANARKLTTRQSGSVVDARQFSAVRNFCFFSYCFVYFRVCICFCLYLFRKLTARQSGSVVGEKQVSDLHFSPFLKNTTKVQSRTTRTVRKNMVTLQCLELVTANFQLEIVALESES